MTRCLPCQIPEIDDELWFEPDPESFFSARFKFDMPDLTKAYYLVLAEDYYNEYLVELLSGLTDKTADQWILDKVKQ